MQPIHYLEAQPNDRRHCFIEAHNLPCDFYTGLPVQPILDRLELTSLDLHMDEDEGGLELGDYVGNTDGILVLRRRLVDAILANFAVGDRELIPVRLINEKKRVHSDDYAILNPLGEFDIIDRERSTISVHNDIVAVDAWEPWCIQSALVPEDRDLFRVLGLPGYLFSDRLVRFILDSGFTNISFWQVELS